MSGPVLQHRYGIRTQSGNQAITAGTTTTVNFGAAKETEVGIEWSNTNKQWTIDQPGIYWVTVSIEWDNTGAGSGRRVTNIALNGAAYATNDVSAPGIIGALATETTTVTSLVPCAAGDVISATVFSTNAANIVGADSTRLYFAIHGVTL